MEVMTFIRFLIRPDYGFFCDCFNILCHTMEQNKYLIVQFLRKYRFFFLIVLLAVTSVFFISLRDLKTDNSLHVWFPKNDSSYIRYEEFLHEFGTDEVVITLVTDSVPFTSILRLQKTDTLIQEIENLEGVSRSLGLTHIPVSIDENQVYTIHDVLFDSARMIPVQKKIENWHENRLLNRFTGKDAYALVFYTWMDTLASLETRRGNIIHSIDSLAKASLISKKGKVYQGGVGVIYQALNDETLKEGPFMFVASYGLILISIFFFTRRFFWVMLSFLVVTLSNITVFGIMALAHQPVNMVSVAIPPLVMVTGIANIIHVARHSSVSKPEIPVKNNIVLSALLILSFPLFFNALTTSGGFLSLVTAGMKITRLYGVFSAIGVMASLIYSYLLIAMLTPTSIKTASLNRVNIIIRKIFKSLFLFSITNKKSVIVSAIVLTIVFLYGISRLTIDTESFEFLSNDNPLRVQSKIIEDQTGYYMPFDFVISYENRNWKQRDFLLKLNRLQDSIEKDPRFGTTYSIADIILDAYSLTYGTPNPGRNTLNRLSQRQILMLASGFRQHKASGQLVSGKGKKLRLTVTGPIVSAKTMMKLAEEIEMKARKVFGDRVIIKPSGYLPMYSRLIDRLLHDQVVSILTAFGIIILLTGLFLRSWRLLLIALPSNILPVIMILGIMGFAGINIDTATITISAAIIGIIVDDTFHILYALKKNIPSHDTLQQMVDRLTAHTGEAVIYTSIILWAGFTIIGFSAVKSISITGWLIALAILLALVTDLILLPALAYHAMFKKSLKSI